MPNTEAALQYGLALRGKICYSMSNRLGAGAMDCSSFVFRSLIAAGLLPKHTAIGNTETLFGLNGTLLKEITRQEVRRGDLWVAGHEGASLGSAGHCGWFLGISMAMHCIVPTPKAVKTSLLLKQLAGWAIIQAYQFVIFA